MTLITDTKTLKDACKALSGCDYITLDTEFLRDKTYYPKLCLVQLSGPGHEAVAIDPLAEGIDLAPLFDLLFDPKILKVLHACRQDLEIFFQLTGKVVTPLFDTQIAAMVCGYGDSVGYEALVRNITGNQLDKSVQFTDWSRRPLSKKQLDYALGDVTYLKDIYKHMLAELEKSGRTEWLLQEEEILADPATYQNPPREAWQRIKLRTPRPKTLAVLRELAAWREEKAQSRDIPRSWILRDDTLADMAAQAPQDAKELKKIRNISADIADGNTGKTLLELIQKGLKTPKDQMPQPEKKMPLPPQAAATVDVLRMLLKVQCAESGVATKLVASQEEIEEIAMDDNADVPALKGWRYELFGRQALELKKGKLAIGLKDSKITKFSVSGDSAVYSNKS
jgi:ribonuclease D